MYPAGVTSARNGPASPVAASFGQPAPRRRPVLNTMSEASMFRNLSMGRRSAPIALVAWMTFAASPVLAAERPYDPARLAALAAPDYWMTGAASPVLAADPAADPMPETATFTRLLDAFAAAERAYDSARLAALITPDYVEVSPVGDVDTRDQVLGFYAPANRIAAPDIAIDAVEARSGGETAVVTARLSFAITGPDGRSVARAMRGGFVMRRGRDGWRIAFAQYTSIPSAKPQERGS